MALQALTDLRGVGPALAEKLQKLGISTPTDLLFLLPLRYEDRTRLTPIGGLVPGKRAVVEGEIELTEITYRRRRIMLCRIADGTGSLLLRFFYFSGAQQQGLARGQRVRCYGEIRKSQGMLEIVHPEYRLLKSGREVALENTLTPIYPGTEGLQQGRLRNLISQVLENNLHELHDELPPTVVEAHKLGALAEAVKYLHNPPADAHIDELSLGRHPAQMRLAIEELVAHHLSLKLLRTKATRLKAQPLMEPEGLCKAFIQTLEFKLTGDQQKALRDVQNDLQESHPMMRLVQGDVGCGKTIVAAVSALQAVGNGAQVAIMAPTELLAEQHRDNFARWFKPLDINIAWLSGSLRASQRKPIYTAIAGGTAQIIIGTHALFQEAVEYQQLGLVIVDEQHRFGVHQRISLMEKGLQGEVRPHQLVMTATPIPRTLAMTMYADLDVSIIREMPPGRQSIATVALADERRNKVVERVRHAIANGQRAYWVCPLIEESDALDYQDAESTFMMLETALKGRNVGLIHGRMSSEQKDAVMKRFASGALQVLVATTVIEVGVDVPEATLMIIENAERMGLAQLHQLRGRVGRGTGASACVLIHQQPLSAIAHERLEVMRETNDGFKVAQKDLELRGPGEVLGKRQTGLMQMRVADLSRDAHLLPTVQKIAADIVRDDPNCAQHIIDRWIVKAEQYGSV